MSALAAHGWARTALVVILALVVLAPVFGWAAGAVGYAEPIENAAELTGATDHETTVIPGLFPDYTTPGMSGGVGTLVAGLIGTTLTLGVALGMGRVLDG